jgi:hypothetical protein
VGAADSCVLSRANAEAGAQGVDVTAQRTPDDRLSETALYDFLCRRYVQRSDERQRQMGLVYMTAETHDLAKQIADYIKAAKS